MTTPARNRVREKCRKRLRYMIRRIKEEMICEMCGVRWKPIKMHFHHRDESEKEMNVSEVPAHGSFTKLASEISKCDLLCAYCHIYVVHAGEERTG
jgi:hypothetical protein